MRIKALLIGIMSIISVYCNAQVGLVNHCEYYMSVRPALGYLTTSSDISNGANSKLNQEGKGLSYGLDWDNATWTYVEGTYLVPQIQVPVKLRYMSAGSNGLMMSDGTVLPSRVTQGSKSPAFSYLDFGVNLYYCPVYFGLGDVVISPRFGVGIDLAKHDYEIDLSKFIGKDGTNPNLQNQLNAISPLDGFYGVSFWEDLYGINLGTYINIGPYITFDGGWEYYPIRFMRKRVGMSIKQDFGDNSVSTPASKAMLSRLAFEARYNISSTVAVFVRYESSDYEYGAVGGISTGGGVLLDKNDFNQKDYNLLFGLAIGGINR